MRVCGRVPASDHKVDTLRARLMVRAPLEHAAARVTVGHARRARWPPARIYTHTHTFEQIM
jgi:hypothetical protein